jgi:gluconokinase
MVYFGRMLDKIRSHAKGELPPEYEVNLGKGFDEKCTTFLRVRYELVVEYVNRSMPDEAILESCFGMGHRPTEAEIFMWNEFMRKRGWHDDLSEILESGKKREAMLPRSEIQTMFQFMDVDEGRLVEDDYIKSCRSQTIPRRQRVTIPAKEWPFGEGIKSAHSNGHACGGREAAKTYLRMAYSK